MVKRVVYQVRVAGQDISSRLRPLLTELKISDHEGTHSDTASITVDDRDAVIRFPKTGDRMSVSLGWEGEGMAVVFVGTVDEVSSNGSRGGGRELTIAAKGVDTQSKAKEPQQLHIDNVTVKAALEKASKIAGITAVKVDQAFASIIRPWWGLHDESFLHFGERVARELGGIFKIRGTEALLAVKNGGSVSGAAMPTITAAYAVNLIRWDMTPAIGRPRHRRVRTSYYDPKEAKWKTKEVDVRDENVEPTASGRFSRADEGEAEGAAKNGAKEAERQKGGGTVEIDGNASAQPGGTCILTGARPGIDGTYRIKSVDHSYSRSGWTTNLELTLPTGEAGKDGR